MESAREVRSALASSAGTLEVAGIEYSEAVEEGEIVNDPEYRGALDALASSRDRFEEVRPAVVAFTPERADEIVEAFEKVEGLMTDRADEQLVEESLGSLADALTR